MCIYQKNVVPLQSQRFEQPSLALTALKSKDILKKAFALFGIYSFLDNLNHVPKYCETPTHTRELSAYWTWWESRPE